MDIDIEDEKIIIQSGDTKISVKGILGKKHAVMLVGLILAILGIKEFNFPV